MKKLISFILRKIPRKHIQLISGPSLKIIGFFLRGNKVTCPIIEKSYRMFLPYGRKSPRSNALCPDSQSLERHRLIWLYLKRKTNFFLKSQKFLHIAPESCFIKPFKKQHKKGYITADLESPLATVKTDIHQMPFEDNEFDIVMCNHVMEHVRNDIQAMQEIFRVLKHNGWAIIQVPFFKPIPKITFEDDTIINPKERERAFGQDDHVRLYGFDYKERLSKVGFEVIEDRFIDELTDNEIKKFALPDDETIFLCLKN